MERFWAFSIRDGSYHDVNVWSAETFELEFKLRGHTMPVYALCFSSDQLRLGSGSMDGTAKIWDLQSRSQLFHFDHSEWSEAIKQVCFSNDGTKLLVGMSTGHLIIWDLETPQAFRVHNLDSDYDRVFCSINNNMVAFCGPHNGNRSLCVHDTDSKSITVISAREDCNEFMCVSPSADVFASAHKLLVKVWQCERPFAQVAVLDHAGKYTFNTTVGRICFSPYGDQLITCSAFHGHVIIWDWSGGIPIRQLDIGLEDHVSKSEYAKRFASGHKLSCRAMTCFSDGIRLLLAMNACFIVLDLETGTFIHLSKHYNIEGCHLLYTPPAVVLL